MSKDLFPKHFILELSKINVKEEKSMISNFEGSQRKKDSNLQRNTHQAMMSIFLSRNSTGQQRVEWHTQNIERLKTVSQEYSIQQSYRCGEVKAFSGKQKLREFITTRLGLTRTVEESSYTWKEKVKVRW